jgi:hypothetical protein
MSKVKMFKRLSAAMKAAQGRPFVKIAGTYIVIDTDLVGIKITDVSLLVPSQRGDTAGYAGQITMGHLNRLGNANYAEATKPMNHCDAFPK